jgi:predicted NBD/HSP70 family sugar kinase
MLKFTAAMYLENRSISHLLHMPKTPQTKSVPAPKSPKVLVIDVGGTHIKLLTTGQTAPVKIPSGPSVTASEMVRIVKEAVHDWKFDCITLGYPGPIINGHPLREPHNLGHGWVGFDFTKAFGCPVKVTNDAAMQALGSYQGGRMLFLGLGTGLGSAMIVDGVLEPMELAHLMYKHGKTYEDYLGLRGLKRMGKKKWRHHVAKVVKTLMASLEADYVVLGGGNSKKVKELPPGARRGSNENAFIGGFRLWEKGEVRYP